MIQRKGKATKYQLIENEVKKAKTIKEVYDILDCSKFRLTSAEEIQIAQMWAREQEMLFDHGLGVLVNV